MADERLEEDALRVLRVYRFAASPPPHHATWTVDGPLRAALRTRAPGLTAILPQPDLRRSAERPVSVMNGSLCSCSIRTAPVWRACFAA